VFTKFAVTEVALEAIVTTVFEGAIVLEGAVVEHEPAGLQVQPEK
jgi:hypothetical protein